MCGGDLLAVHGFGRACHASCVKCTAEPARAASVSTKLVAWRAHMVRMCDVLHVCAAADALSLSLAVHHITHPREFTPGTHA